MPENIKSFKLAVPFKRKAFMVYRAYQYALSDTSPFIFRYVSLNGIKKILKKMYSVSLTLNQIKYQRDKLIKSGLLERKIYYKPNRPKSKYQKTGWYRFKYFDT